VPVKLLVASTNVVNFSNVDNSNGSVLFKDGTCMRLVSIACTQVASALADALKVNTSVTKTDLF
jgi:hypothetical protein